MALFLKGVQLHLPFHCRQHCLRTASIGFYAFFSTSSVHVNDRDFTNFLHSELRYTAFHRRQYCLRTALLRFYDFFCTSSVHVNVRDFTNFLRLELRYTESVACAIAGKLPEIPSLQNARNAVRVFNDLGFTWAQVRNVWIRSPNVFLEKSDCIKAKLQLFRSLGLKHNHRLLTCDFERCILPTLNLLSECGIEGELLVMLVNKRPGILSGPPDTVKGYLEIIRNMGIDGASERFVAGLAAFQAIGSVEKIKERIRVLESFGVRQDELSVMFRTHPGTLTYSTEKLRRNMKFLVHVVGYPPNIIATYPPFLSFSVEGRIKPRYKVFQHLKRAFPSYDTRKFTQMLMLTDEKFADFVVTPDPDVARELLEVLDK